MADTIVTDSVVGADRTARLNMIGADTLTVETGASFSVTANAQAVRFNGPTDGAVINNDGTIEAVGAQEEPRAIRFEDTVGANLKATINNTDNGVIRSINDAIQIQAGAVTSGKVTVNNSGSIESTNGQAIDFAGGTGTFITAVANSGDISSATNDGVRIGGVGDIHNSGTIDGGTDATHSQGSDGIQFEDDTTGTVTNSGPGALITGDRHGINAGEGSQINVINQSGANITGRNGSGVGSDGAGSVTNYGTITGSFANIAGSDEHGPGTPDVPDGVNDGDGDGVDIDLEAFIENYGTIQGTGAGGHGSDGLPNTSEGIAAGGGRINNYAGASIVGLGLGILIDNSSQGNANFQTTINNAGTIEGTESFGIKILSALDDKITNSGTISGGNGVAIQFGSGNNTLAILDGSVINGTTEAGLGTDTLDYSSHTSGVTVDLTGGSATGTGGVTGFETVVGSNASDTITGSTGTDTLNGGGGDDALNGGGGNDNLVGGLGNDTYTTDGGDTITEAANAGTDTVRSSAVTYTLTANVENLTLTGASAANGAGNGLANILNGNNANNYLYGLDGHDRLNAGGGNDIVVGGNGNDVVYGGAGKDNLAGSAGVDYFDFKAVSESTVGANRDVVADFSHAQGDKINLVQIDADTGVAGNQAFTFIGDAAFTAAGQARYANGVLQVNVDGTLGADMEIQVTNAPALTAADLIL